MYKTHRNHKAENGLRATIADKKILHRSEVRRQAMEKAKEGDKEYVDPFPDAPQGVLKFKNRFDPADFTDKELEKEIDLIRKKKSKLSAKERNKTLAYYYYRLEQQKKKKKG